MEESKGEAPPATPDAAPPAAAAAPTPAVVAAAPTNGAKRKPEGSNEEPAAKKAKPAEGAPAATPPAAASSVKKPVAPAAVGSPKPGAVAGEKRKAIPKKQDEAPPPKPAAAKPGQPPPAKKQDTKAAPAAASGVKKPAAPGGAAPAKPAAGSSVKKPVDPNAKPAAPSSGNPPPAKKQDTKAAPNSSSVKKPAAAPGSTPQKPADPNAKAATTTVKKEGAAPATPKPAAASGAAKSPAASSTVKKEGGTPATASVKKEGGTPAAKPKTGAAAAPSTPKKTPAKPAAASGAKKPAPKKKEEEESDSSSSDSDSSGSDSSSEEEVIKGKPKPKGKGATPRKKKKKNSDEEEYSSDSDSSDSSDSSDDDDEPKRKRAKKSGGGGVKEHRSEMLSVDKFEMMPKAIALEPTMGANKWWNRKPRDAGIKWETLQHNACIFPEPYKPHGVRMKYEGKEVELTPDQEEIASMFAAMLETDHAKNPVFRKNFFKDWKRVLGEKHVIKEMDKCDFTPIHSKFTKEREELKEKRKDPTYRKEAKAEREALQNIYGWALIDGYKEKVGNFKVEPPGLFRGRGQHPKTGSLKHRVIPEEVIINVAPNTPIPKAPDGHKWKGIVHNNKVTWLAFWNDNVNGDFKYVWLAASSRFKGQSDMKKYEKAQKLKGCVGQIRKKYTEEMKSPKEEVRQRATAIYLIDKLALRVGNEKDTSEVADTVGCCSLRVEHLTFEEPNKVTFDFLGKDSMRYFNTVAIDQQAWDNLKSFCQKKKKTDDVFHRVDTGRLNEDLGQSMTGLTAKVFRTYNASVTLQEELEHPSDGSDLITEDDTDAAKVLYYNRANRQVAILCNHQRSIPKQFTAQMDKMLEQKASIEAEAKEVEERLEAATGKGKKRKANSEKGGDPTKLKAQLARIRARLDTCVNKIALKEDTKTVALGTSKINYMDPRITIAWCKRLEVPLEKIFNASLLAKFPWAMEVDPDWKF